MDEHNYALRDEEIIVKKYEENVNESEENINEFEENLSETQRNVNEFRNCTTQLRSTDNTKKQKFNNTEKIVKYLENEERKINDAKLKHPRKEISCERNKCKNECFKLSIEYQKQIWDNFWSINYTSRRKFLAKCVHLRPVKRRTVEAQQSYKRNETRVYTIPGPEKTDVKVCKTTLLNILGYTNDSVITELIKAMQQAPRHSILTENRGKHNNNKVINKEPIINHIRKYEPAISHYCRHISPNMFYLPRDLTVKKMFDDFCVTNNNYCSLELYRSVLKSLNISLHKPKLDLCEDCSYLNNLKVQNSFSHSTVKRTIQS